MKGHPDLQKKCYPLPPTLHATKKMIGPIIFKNGRGARTFSSAATYVSTGTSDERGWSPRPYPINGRTDRSQTLVGATIGPRRFEVPPTPPTFHSAGKMIGPIIFKNGRGDHEKTEQPGPGSCLFDPSGTVQVHIATIQNVAKLYIGNIHDAGSGGPKNGSFEVTAATRERGTGDPGEAIPGLHPHTGSGIFVASSPCSISWIAAS
jgi:hypothetical protein